MAGKICALCKEVWPNDSEFYRTKSASACIACENEQGIKPKKSPLAGMTKKERDKIHSKASYARNKEQRLIRFMQYRLQKQMEKETA